MSPPELFDRAARRQRRDRVIGGDDFLRETMVSAIEERLSLVRRTFSDVLQIGVGDREPRLPPDARVVRIDPAPARAAQRHAIQADEDHLPFADDSFDLVFAIGTLDTVADLPGALLRIRQLLRPDGLFFGALLGARSLSMLRPMLRSIEAERPVARFHPMVELRTAGDLLVRAGFALPVADQESVTVRYRTLDRLLADLRAMSATNVLADRTPLARGSFARLHEAFAELAHSSADDRVAERFEIIMLTGWAPSPDQPKPARRGSAVISLAEALKPAG